MSHITVSPHAVYDDDGVPDMLCIPSCALVTETLASYNDYLTERGHRAVALYTFTQRWGESARAMQQIQRERGETVGTREITRHGAKELVNVSRWAAPADYRAKPVPARADLWLNMRFRGERTVGLNTREPGPLGLGPNDELVIDLEVLREDLMGYAYAEDRDGVVEEPDIMMSAFRCLTILSHPAGWYPAPIVDEVANLHAVTRRAFEIICAEVQRHTDGAGESGPAPADAAWSATAWLRDATVPDVAGRPSGELYGAYSAWCEAKGCQAASDTAWGRVLTDAGYPSQKRRDKRYRALKPRPA